MTVNRFDVWLASVKFADRIGRKNRPAIIWKVYGDGAYAAIPVTTHAPRKDQGDYVLACHCECGVPKRSVARCRGVMDLCDDDLVEFRGKLQPIDIVGIQTTMSVLDYRRRK